MRTTSQEKLSQSWDRYLHAESSGSREEGRQQLAAFLRDFENAGPELQKSAAAALAQTAIERSPGFPVRQQLLENVLMPHLIDLTLAREPGAAKSLCGVFALFFKGWSDQRPEQHLINLLETFPDLTALFLHALEEDPFDRELIEWTHNLLQTTVEQSLEKLPACVLGPAGEPATTDDCQALQKRELQWLRETARRLGRDTDPNTRKLIDKAHLHYQAYPRYLSGGHQETYAAFLSRRG